MPNQRWSGQSPEQSIREEKSCSAYWQIKAELHRSAPPCVVLAEIIASDVSRWLNLRPLVSSLSGNLQRFGMEKIAKVESLQEIIADMTETNAASDAPTALCPMS